MFIISNMTDAAFQTATIQMPDGSNGTLNLYYRASTPRWFFDFVHPQFPSGSVLGLGLTAYPNLLRQWENLIDFGFACSTLNSQDPVSAQDFINGYATLYILDANDVLTVEAQVFNDLTAQQTLAAQVGS